MDKKTCIFDGTNQLSVEKSLSKVLHLSCKKLQTLIHFYFIDNLPNIDFGNLSLQNFCEYCNGNNFSINMTDFHFDKVIFFHKSSLIDEGLFLQENGLLDLDKLLTIPSPLSKYLKQKGVEFFFENEIPFINIRGKIKPINDLPCGNTKSSKTRIIARLTKNGSLPLEGISGFLFMQDAIINGTYQRITYVPEFLIDLNDCLGGISSDWQKTSKQVVIKCEVDINKWFRPGDLYEQENISEKSNEIATESFLFLAEAYARQYSFNTSLRSSNYFPFISHGTGIPSNQIIEFI